MAEENRDEDEYVWRFKLEDGTAVSEDPLADMIRSFVEGVLEIGCFTRHGKDAHVDGFRLNDRKGVIALAVKKGG